jgi:hypothetical protein
MGDAWRSTSNACSKAWHAVVVGGGMASRRGPTLAERTDARQAPPAAGAAGPRHCWVLDPPRHPRPCPGLLLEWRKVGEQWLGLVAFADIDARGLPQIVQQWLPAACLRPLA